MMVQFHATTICAVKRPNGDICIGGDGQVTMGETTIMKNGAKKVKKIFKGKVLTGFAGSVADAFSLTDKFENKLQEHDGNLKRAAVDLAQFWRSDKATRSLEALMIVVNEEDLLVISGNGEVGLVKKYNGKFNAYQRTYVLQNFIENMDYIKCYIEYFLPKRIQKEKNVGAMPYIVLSTLYDMNIAIPSIETQNQISKIIDTIINFIECEYDIQAKYELQKQFLLRRMFI